LLLTFATLTGLVFAGANSGGMKGRPVPSSGLVTIIVSATIADAACRKMWRPWMSPLFGGLAGGFAGGPYGVVLGVPIGAMILVMPTTAKPIGNETIQPNGAGHDG
jgi:hypothetical protein